ncbi:MAG TPA: SpoIID/LytB domain-containing protein [Gemmatimonadaceae bacterium]|jgi:stage II sporulation protein D|nr:SpoIID/LytB domain-containing protein [Gemmatimonadaceae bacterium]
MFAALAIAAIVGTSPPPTSARIAIANGVHDGKVSATGTWLLLANGGSKTLVRGTGRGTWTITRRPGGKLRVTNERGETATRPGPLVARATGDGVFVTWNGKRYRGELEIRATSEGLLVINRLQVEDYLRGVIPLELGDISDAELAAMEAQAVAARSYTYVRLADPDLRRRAYDLVATTTDQVYGGAGAESRLGDEAVQQTTGEVIRYNGRIVNAPYFAACGGMTAAASEIWREGDLPYLRPVSDLIPGSGGQYYCQGSSKFRWSRTFSGPQLETLLETYLHRHAGSLGAVKTVIADGPTPSGRVASLTLVTDRNYYKFRGNEMRSVLRSPNGEILNSTYFELDVDGGTNGHVESLTLRGLGNGHGVGMCQAGAIGRARAGQDYRTILETYYPGTVVATVE